MKQTTDRPPHPGRIAYIDGNTGATISEEPVEKVPEDMRYADTASGPVPVVKVVSTTTGDRRWIREYGPAGELLRSTMQTKQPPR